MGDETDDPDAERWHPWPCSLSLVLGDMCLLVGEGLRLSNWLLVGLE